MSSNQQNDHMTSTTIKRRQTTVTKQGPPKIKSTASQLFKLDGILPQYSSLSEYSFCNNSLHPTKTVQQTKDKLSEIFAMMRQSSSAVALSNHQNQQSHLPLNNNPQSNFASPSASIPNNNNATMTPKNVNLKSVNTSRVALPSSTTNFGAAAAATHITGRPSLKSNILPAGSTLETGTTTTKSTTGTSQLEGNRLKDGNTITWLKKRYLESGNRKYFGDSEDVQQSTFIRALFENITKHLQNFNSLSLTSSTAANAPTMQQSTMLNSIGVAGTAGINQLNANSTIGMTNSTNLAGINIIGGQQQQSQQLSSTQSGQQGLQNSQSPCLIHIGEFSRLLNSFELPMSFATLTRIYAIVDTNRDNALDLEEFGDFLLSEAANRIYLDSLQQSAKQFANLPYKPTSLAALCIFVSFRINHDFLIEFLFDPNFQVKDKSQGLAKMLELIKMQGEIRIKSEFDKRMIRQLKMESVFQKMKTAIANSQKNEENNNNNNNTGASQNRGSFFVADEQNAGNEIDSSNRDFIEETSTIKCNFNEISDEEDLGINNEESETDSSNAHLKRKRRQRGSRSPELKFKRQSQSMMSLKLPSIAGNNPSTDSSIVMNGNKTQKKQKVFRKSMLQEEIDAILEEANHRGQESAISSFEQNKERISKLRVNALETGFYWKPKPQQKYKRMDFEFNRSLLDSSTISTHNKTKMTTQNAENSVMSSKESIVGIKQNHHNNNSSKYLNNMSMSYLHNMSKSSGGAGEGYSKQMGHLMEFAMLEADESRQAKIARKLINFEDSDVIKQAKMRVQGITQVETSRAKQYNLSKQVSQKDLLSPGALQLLEGSSFVQKYKSFFPDSRNLLADSNKKIEDNMQDSLIM